MKTSFYKLGTLLVLLVQLNNSIAQTKIWGVGSGVGEADAQFSNAFVNSTTASGYSTTQWTALTVYESGGVVTPGNAYWVRNLTGVSQGGYATGMSPLASPSAANGAALFDSDFMDNGGVQGAFGTGISPSPHKGELISPRIDLTGYTNLPLAVKFYSYYRRFSINNYSISISVDDGTTWVASEDIQALQPVAVNADVEGSVTAIFNTATQGVANLTQCRIKFTFDGDYYYAFLDDITIEDILPNIPNIVISEIMYNGPESGTDSTEFIEIYNNDSVAVDLTNYTCTGVTYTFPNVSLSVGEYYVIAVNAVAFNNVFGFMPDGQFSGTLNNGGEFITLKDNFGNLVDSVFYDDVAPWPSGTAAGEPDGGGSSLILCNVNADNNDGTNWKACTNQTGVIIQGYEVLASPSVANFCCPVLLGIDTQVACDSLVWIDGNTYYSNNTTATFVTQTAQGCDSTVTLNLTVTNGPSNQTVSASQTTFCPGGGSATVDLASSENGVKYYLRNDANDTIVAGPVVGTGNGLSLNTGNVTTTTTYNVYAEKLNSSALEFTGNSGLKKVSLGTAIWDDNFVGQNQLTVEAWVKRSSLGSLHTIFSNYEGSYPLLFRIDGDKITMYVNSGTSVQSISSIPVGVWTHVAGTYDGANLKVYINGVLEGTQPFTSNFIGTTTELKIGGGLNNNTEYFLGDIADVRLWNVAKTQSEIAAGKDLILNGNEANLIANYQFTEGSGTTTANSATGNAYPGTLVNNPAWVSGPSVFNTPTCSNEMTQLITISVNDVTAPVPDVANLPDITSECVVSSLTEPTATDDCSGNTRLTILPPTSIAGVNTNVGVANFGPQTFNINGQCIIAQDITPDSLCCDTITNDYTGKIAVIYRGACSFELKVKNIQTTGAIGVIIVNNQGGATVEEVLGTDTSIVIPIFMVSTDDGLALMNEINLGNVDVIMERRNPITITNNAILPITTPGTIVVTWTYDDGNGNTSTQNQNVIIPSIDNTIDNSLMPTLTANQSGATYQWLDCDNGNAIIPSETAQSFTATANGNYAVEVTIGGCADTSACEAVTGVGVKEVANNTVSIYPNPTSGMVNINLGSNNTSVNYSITSIEGKVIEAGKTSTNNIIVDLSKEGNGVYFIKVNTESSSTVYKLIKQ